MLMLILLSISLLLPLILGISIRNSRGVFILYFLASVIVPYGFYVFQNEIPSFLFPYINQENIGLGIFLIWISFLIIIFSSISLKNKKYKNLEPLFINQNSVYTLAILSTLFFICYIVISIIFAGNINEAFVSAYSRVRTNSSLANVRAVFLWGCIVLSTICAYILFHGKVIKSKFKILIIINIIFAGFLSIMDGGRAVFLMYLLSLLFGYIIKLSLGKLMSVLLQFTVVVSIVSYIMIKVRYETQNAQIIEDGSIPISETVNGLAYFDHFLISMQYAQDKGYVLGGNYFNAFISFVPRDLYADKAIPLAAQVRNYLYGDDTGGIPPGLLGEAFISGGILGLLVICVMYGRLLNITSELCNKAAISNCPIRLAIAGILIPMIGFTLVRGGLDIGFIRVGLPVFWCLFAVKILAIKKF